MTRRRTLLLLGASLLPVRAGAAERHAFERPLMGTRFSIVCHGEKAAATEAARVAFEAADEINAVASDYIADSEILRLSRAPTGEPVELSPLLFRLLSEAIALAEKTRGLFDPTLGPLTKLWRESRRRGRLPNAATLAEARAACGWENLRLADRTATLLVPGMRLDLGGIAKGQAADAMLDVFHKYGLPRTCITAGGDVRAGGPPPDAAAWKIGAGEDVIELANAAVSTSGDLHQFIEIAGTRYSHIIDPATGLGLTRGVSARVTAPTATLSDALATACCVAAPDAARQMALHAGASEVALKSGNF